MMNQMKTKMKMRRLNEVVSVIAIFIVVLETSLECDGMWYVRHVIGRANLHGGISTMNESTFWCDSVRSDV
eukprot:scaffold132897_cov34-Cyclotella_meneghiniana.AAC.2